MYVPRPQLMLLATPALYSAVSSLFGLTLLNPPTVVAEGMLSLRSVMLEEGYAVVWGLSLCKDQKTQLLLGALLHPPYFLFPRLCLLKSAPK